MYRFSSSVFSNGDVFTDTVDGYVTMFVAQIFRVSFDVWEKEVFVKEIPKKNCACVVRLNSD